MRLTKYTKVAIWGLASAGLGIGVGCSDSTIIFDPSFDGSVVVDSTTPTDSQPNTQDATSDGGKDASGDASGADGSTPDSSTSDSGPGDSGPGDSGPGDSGSADSGPGDSGSGDSGPRDGGPFINADAGDGGTVVTLVYAENVAAALCSNLASCCVGPFDQPKCVNALKRGGLDNVWQGLEVSGVKTAGRVTVNDTLSDECFALIAATNLCSPMGGATSRALMAKCGGAVQGTVAAGSACHADIECVSGNFCAGMNAGAGIEGICTAVSGLGESCDYARAGYNGRVTNCSTRGQGDNGRYCATGAGATCVPLLPAGAACNANFECANQYCTFNVAGNATICDDAPIDQGACFFGQ